MRLKDLEERPEGVGPPSGAGRFIGNNTCNATSPFIAEPGPQGWGGINARPSALVYLPPVWTLLFDEGTTRADSYDEQCMLAVSTDLWAWRRLTPPHAPWVRSSHASGSVRYVDVVIAGRTVHYFYEYARADRAHELRHAAVPLSAW